MAIAQPPPFARLLRRYRLEAELTQEELAERAGLSARAISDLERGAKTRPRRATVDLLADALQLPADDRSLLLAAVPRATGSPAAWPASIVDSPVLAQTRLRDVRLAECPRELQTVMDGLVGLFVDGDRHGQQINIAVFIFSVSQEDAVAGRASGEVS